MGLDSLDADLAQAKRDLARNMKLLGFSIGLSLISLGLAVTVLVRGTH